MADGIDPTLPLKVSPPNPTDQVNAYATLQRGNLYNLQTAIQQRNYLALQKYGAAAAGGDDDAFKALVSEAPELGEQVIRARNMHLQNQQLGYDFENKQTSGMAQAVQALGQVPPEQRVAKATELLSNAVQQGRMHPEQGQFVLNWIQSNPKGLDALIARGQSAKDYMSTSGQEAANQGWAKLGPALAEESGKKEIEQGYQSGLPRAVPQGEHFYYPPPSTLPYSPRNMLPQGGVSGVVKPSAATSDTSGTDQSALPASAFVQRVFNYESGDRNVMNSKGSPAGGPGQFIPETFAAQFKKNHPDEAANMSDADIKALRLDPTRSRELQAEATVSYAQDNAKYLSDHDQPVNAATLAMAHSLGPQGAEAVLSVDPKTSMRDILADINPKAAAQNPGWAKMNAGTFIRSYENRMGTSPVSGVTVPSDQGSADTTDTAASPAAGPAAEPAVATTEIPQPTGTGGPINPVTPDAQRAVQLPQASGSQPPTVLAQATTTPGGPTAGPPGAGTTPGPAPSPVGPAVGAVNPPAMSPLTVQKVPGGGSVVSNPNTPALTDLTFGSLKNYNETQGKQIADWIAERQKEAYAGMGMLKAANELSKSIDNLQTGPGTTDTVKARQFLARFGISIDNVLPEGWESDLTKSETALKNINLLASAMARQMFPQRITNNDMVVAFAANPGIDFNNPDANKILIESLRSLSRIKMDEAKFFREDSSKFGPSNLPNWTFIDRWVDHVTKMKDVPDNIKQAYFGYELLGQHPEIKVEEMRTPNQVKESTRNQVEAGAPVSVPAPLKGIKGLQHQNIGGKDYYMNPDTSEIFDSKGTLVPKGQGQ